VFNTAWVTADEIKDKLKGHQSAATKSYKEILQPFLVTLTGKGHNVEENQASFPKYLAHFPIIKSLCRLAKQVVFAMPMRVMEQAHSRGHSCGHIVRIRSTRQLPSSPVGN